MDILNTNYHVNDLHRRGIIKRGAVSDCPSVCRVPQPNSRMESPRKLKLRRMEAHDTSNLRTYLDVKKIKGTRSPAGRLMLSPKVRHIFLMERPTNFKLDTQMKHKDPHHLHA